MQWVVTAALLAIAYYAPRHIRKLAWLVECTARFPNLRTTEPRWEYWFSSLNPSDDSVRSGLRHTSRNLIGKVASGTGKPGSASNAFRVLPIGDIEPVDVKSVLVVGELFALRPPRKVSKRIKHWPHIPTEGEILSFVRFDVREV